MIKYADYLVKWIKEEVDKTGAKGVVIGLSGGIDSALVSLLAKRAMGDNSILIWIDIESSEFFYNLAKKHSLNIKMELKEIKLTKVFNDLIGETIENNPIDNNHKMAIANTKSRLRMATLYAFARKNNYLVLGTSNRDEIYMGYFTKWGDGSSDIYPIASLSKLDILKVSKDVGIIDEILEVKPSADLWEEQTDEEDMGVTYEQINNYINKVCINEKAGKIIERYHKNSIHKTNEKMVKPLERKKWQKKNNSLMNRE